MIADMLPDLADHLLINFAREGDLVADIDQYAQVEQGADDRFTCDRVHLVDCWRRKGLSRQGAQQLVNFGLLFRTEINAVVAQTDESRVITE